MHMVENKEVRIELEKAKETLSAKTPTIKPKAKDIPALHPKNSIIFARAGVGADGIDKVTLGQGFYASAPLKDIPEKPGIYVIWAQSNMLYGEQGQNSDVLPVYVGQSKRLSKRLHPNVHKQIRTLISLPPFICWVMWAECKETLLDFAECQYISMLRPSLNFGKNAKWLAA